MLELSKKFNLPVLVTNQVYASFSRENGSSPQKEVEPVGGHTLKYWCKTVIELKKKGSLREAVLIRHRHLPEKISLSFRITATGLQEL